MWPHRRQPTRLPCPWDSPGKNTGVGCHFLLQCMKVKSESEAAQLCPTLATPWTAACQAPPSMGFSRPKYWSGVPLPSPHELPSNPKLFFWSVLLVCTRNHFLIGLWHAMKSGFYTTAGYDQLSGCTNSICGLFDDNHSADVKWYLPGAQWCFSTFLWTSWPSIYLFGKVSI